MRIVVLDGHTMSPAGDNPWDAIAALGDFTLYDRTPESRILERARQADILITNKTPLNSLTLEALPNLKCIIVLATGYNVVDIESAGRLGVPVCNIVAYGVNSVAQHVMALLLELCRGCGLHDASVKRGDWNRAEDFTYWLTPQRELTGMTMGIVGFGNIGRRVGELAHAFGMHVLAFSPSEKDAPGYAPFRFTDLDTLFRESEVVSLHCPLTRATEHMVNAKRINTMRDKAFIINTARGPLVNEFDVAAALRSGKLGGLGTDVLSVEPPAKDNPLLDAPGTLITPHLAWASLHARKNITRMAADSIKAFLAGSPVNVVNAAYLK